MGKMDWDLWISRCKLLYIEWINNKVLMCSTGNYIQYLPINPNGKEYKKECVLYIFLYIYIYIKIYIIHILYTTWDAHYT